jgi:SAM-dependent methyltransferase
MNNRREAPDFALPQQRPRAAFGHPVFKRSWTREELLAVFPPAPLDILDVGAGPYPFAPRASDKLTTLDFDQSTGPDIACDFTQTWPVGRDAFDVIYMSHVVEHLYPRDRDRVIMQVFESLRPGGLLFIRVPHWSSIQGTGWEHHTLYGTNGVTSLTHGHNPTLPMFELVSAGVIMGDLDEFRTGRSALVSLAERMMNASFRLTDTYLCYLVGGIPEVQFLLRKPRMAAAG